MAKNLIDRLSVDESNHEYLMKNYQEGGRFKLFSNVFFGKMGVMSKTNWLMLLFCLPAFAVIFYTAYRAFDYSVYTPFSSNFGLGYPVVNDAEEIYAGLMFQNNMFRALLLIPCIVIGCIGLAGAFNVIKYESLGFSVKLGKTFFKGVKNNMVTYMWLGFINALIFFVFELSLNFFGNPELALAVKIIAIVLSAILMAFVVVVSLYVMTQAALYDMPLVKMIKNAFWLTVSFFLQNLIIFILSLVPVVLLMVMGSSYFLQLIVIMVCAMLGFSYIVCIWTIFSHYVYGMVFTACIEKDKPQKKNRRRAK
ncbi:MAG: hypothetical protein J1F36_01340 [Clostridiales bacterium]|nr:hypothetical protein [Clostridiales bacterium]